MNAYQDKDFRVRDRVLLYARGLDLPPAESVEIALKSLERCSSEHPTYAEALENLHIILAERGRELIPSDDKPHLTSVPPIKRSTMLPEELDRTPWMSILKKTFRRLFNALPSVPLRASWKDSAERQLQQKEWGKVAGRRRTLLMTLILVPAIIGAVIMYNIFPDQGIHRFLDVRRRLLAAHAQGGPLCPYGRMRSRRNCRRLPYSHTLPRL